MPKPAHLTWEEAAVNGLCASTSYRMLVGRHAARMKQGDNVFIWGATGGIGAYATQLVLNGGGTPVGVVSSEDRAKLLKAMGCENVIDRGPRATSSGRTSTPRTRASGAGSARRCARSSARTPTSCSSTPAARPWAPRCSSPSAAAPVVTCAATSGFMIEYDNRHLWMKLKTHRSSHFANYQEAWDMNRLIDRGAIQPVMSAVYPREHVGEAARRVHRNEAEGKLGASVPGPEAGLGIADPRKREAIGEDRITLFQRHARRELYRRAAHSPTRSPHVGQALADDVEVLAGAGEGGGGAPMDVRPRSRHDPVGHRRQPAGADGEVVAPGGLGAPALGGDEVPARPRTT